MNKSICVTIDGPSASGKSTVAKAIASSLGFLHIDTGAIYRSMALFCLEKKVDISNESAVIEALKNFHYEFEEFYKKPRHYVNGEDVSLKIRQIEVSQASSKIATFGQVRLIANEYQRQIAEGRDVIVDGRDAGTVVFPSADIKIFLTAKKKERAKRRLRELALKYKGTRKSITLEDVLQEMEERDKRDETREKAPLKRAIDAYAIDTTHLSVKKIVKKIEAMIKKEKQLVKPSRFWTWMLGQDKAYASFSFKFCHLLIHGIFKLFYKIKAHGVENIPKGAAIIAPNHVSFIDPFAVGVMCPYEVYFLAHEYLFKLPIGGKILAKNNTLPLTGSVQDASVLKQIAAFLMKGKQVIVFPEGTRTADGKIKPLKRGIALLASIAECPIVPVYVHGAYEIWPRSKKIPKLSGQLEIYFGKPLHWKDYEHRSSVKKEAQILMMEDLENILKEMQKSAEAKVTDQKK